MATVGAIRSVATDADINEIRVNGLEVLVTDAETFNCSGAKVLNHDIGSSSQLFENINSLWAFEINN